MASEAAIRDDAVVLHDARVCREGIRAFQDDREPDSLQHDDVVSGRGCAKASATSSRERMVTPLIVSTIPVLRPSQLAFTGSGRIRLKHHELGRFR